MMNFILFTICGLAFTTTIAWGVLGKKIGVLYWRRIATVFGFIFLISLFSILPIGVSENQNAGNRDILFLVDASYSMNAKDGRKGVSRLDNAKEDLLAIAQANAGSRFGIISLDTKPQVYMPMTSSFADLEVATKTLITKDYYTSRVASPEISKLILMANNYISNVKKTDASREVVVVLMSDGEITSSYEKSETVIAAAKQLQKVAKGGTYIGYGSDAGSNLEIIKYEYSSNTYKDTKAIIKDELPNKRYGDVITKRDQQLLKDISKQMNGSYVAAENTGDIDGAMSAAVKTAYTSQHSSTQAASARQSIAYAFVAALFFLWLAFTELCGKTKLIAPKGRQK